MARQKKDTVEMAIEQEWYKQGSGVQINIMNISKVFKDCKVEMKQGKTVQEAIANAIVKYREN